MQSTWWILDIRIPKPTTCTILFPHMQQIGLGRGSHELGYLIWKLRNCSTLFLCFLCSNTFLRAWSPASWGMLGYNPTISAVTSNTSLGISLRSLILCIKLFESLMWDIARAFRWSAATQAVALYIFKGFDRVWHAGLLHKCKLYIWNFRSDIWPYFFFS